MEFRFVAPDLRRLDSAGAEVCVASIWSDERPARGFAGLLDWRLGGRLATLMQSGFVQGRRGEVLLVPGKPHVPFEKVVLVGLGARGAFGEDAFREAVMRISATLEGLRVRRAVIELPGRACDAIGAEPAIALTLDCVATATEHDTWWLVETAADQKKIEARAAEERRRTRDA
jgi:hypothetical protein